MQKISTVKLFAASSLLAGLALAAASAASAQAPMQSNAMAAPATMEKCYGVARAGHNDCAAGAHSCAGQSTRDNDPASFVELPAGACAKIAHGSLTAGH
jgi:uncharacterized membrane protein